MELKARHTQGLSPHGAYETSGGKEKKKSKRIQSLNTPVTPTTFECRVNNSLRVGLLNYQGPESLVQMWGSSMECQASASGRPLWPWNPHLSWRLDLARAIYRLVSLWEGQVSAATVPFSTWLREFSETAGKYETTPALSSTLQGNCYF